MVVAKVVQVIVLVSLKIPWASASRTILGFTQQSLEDSDTVDVEKISNLIRNNITSIVQVANVLFQAAETPGAASASKDTDLKPEVLRHLQSNDKRLSKVVPRMLARKCMEETVNRIEEIQSNANTAGSAALQLSESQAASKPTSLLLRKLAALRQAPGRGKAKAKARNNRFKVGRSKFNVKARELKFQRRDSRDREQPRAKDSREDSESGRSLQQSRSHRGFGSFAGPEQTRSAVAMRHIMRIWDAEDKVDNHIAGYNPAKRWFMRWTLSRKGTQKGFKMVRDNKRLMIMGRAELAKLGISYKGLVSVCTDPGEGDAIRECILNGTAEREKDAMKLLLDLNAYKSIHYPPIDQDEQVHTQFKRAYEKALVQGGGNFALSKLTTKCKTSTMDIYKRRIYLHTQQEFLDPVQLRQSGQCIERRPLFCPEGTSAHAPSFVPSLALVGGGAVFLQACILSLYVLQQASQGKYGFWTNAGELLEGVSGLPLPGAELPANWVIYWLDVIVGIIGAAISGKEIVGASSLPDCVCAISACEIDNQKCIIKKAPVQERNPFASSIPPPGLTCKLYKGTCRLQGCDAMDYTDQAGLARNMLENHKLYGKLGRNGTDLFNCLSRTGSPTSSLQLGGDVEDGLSNTAAGRLTLFAEGKVERSLPF